MQEAWADDLLGTVLGLKIVTMNQTLQVRLSLSQYFLPGVRGALTNEDWERKQKEKDLHVPAELVTD